ncbi:response regulator transcription factor [Murimonas intestini]|uniref:response regulator transcription factor n=1 Tax=Murimonas intestini TaxID=1337051 RepID=UPI0011DDFCF5|nr:response regulator [Murimonas intestini]
MLRIVLVDDENTALKGICYILKKFCPQYQVVGAFEDGWEALDCIQKNEVDVVITDMKMDTIQGIDLIDKLKEMKPEIRVVALSAYSDFEYVRLAMKRGASDYLLKPCRHQDIVNLLQHFEKEINARKSQQLKEEMLQEISAVLTGEKEKCECFLEDNVKAVLFQPRNENDREPVAGRIAELLSEQEDVECFALNLPEGSVFLLSSLGSLEGSLPLYQKLFQDMAHKGHCLSAGICFKAQGSFGLRVSYERTRLITGYLKFNGICRLLDWEKYQVYLQRLQDFHLYHYFPIEQIVQMIRKSEDQNLLKMLEKSFRRVSSDVKGLDPVRVRQESLEILVGIKSRLQEDQILKSDTDLGSMHQIGRAETRRQWEDAVKSCLFELYAACENGHDRPKFILEALNYIEANYMNDINVQEVADAVFLNIWYFSAQFKKYTGQNMTKYLNQVRIKHAKELLKDKNLKVYQVAEMVGFQDATYFSTVFKAIEKKTPKKYQQDSQ